MKKDSEDRYIRLTQPSMPQLKEYMNEIKDLWDSRWLTNMGSKHHQLEEELVRYLQADHLTLFANGHLALEAVIAALDLNGEVITTPFTFASTTHAIVRKGLQPVFCDVDREDFTLDPACLEELITPRTSAILPVHVYGNVCRTGEIERIARKYGLKVIYDAAHAFGVTVGGSSVAGFGDASVFSFHAAKVFHTIEGGAVTYKDKDLQKRLELERNFGITGPETVEAAGGNAKMNEFSAAMGLCNLRHIEEEIAGRKGLAERYFARLSGVKGIRLCPVPPAIKSNYAYLPVVFENFKLSRDEAWAKLREAGIEARKYFYPLTSSFACYQGRFDAAKTPVAAYTAERILTLPLYAGLSAEEVDKVCDIILRD